VADAFGGSGETDREEATVCERIEEGEEADSRKTGKSRNKFLSPLHTF
jgi:hypothetical protein